MTTCPQTASPLPLSHLAQVIVVQALLAAGAAVSPRNNAGRTPLLSAANNGKELVCAQLLKAGALEAEADDQGRTAQHYAAAGGGEGVIEALVAAGEWGRKHVAFA